VRRLALKNLKGRKAYSAIIIAACAVAAVMTFFVLFLAGGVRRELENNRRMIGPDLAIVPPGSKERGHIYLSKGPPVQGVVPAETLEQLEAFPEIEAAAPQKRLGNTAPGAGHLIGFDPAGDFVVRPWLDARNVERFAGRDEGLVLGARAPADGFPAALPAPDSARSAPGGRLLATGTFMDTSIFIPRPASEITAEPSWILLRLRPGVSLDIAANRLEVNIPRIEILRRPELFKTINDQLYGLIQGGGLGAAAFLTIITALLVTGAMFALMAHERKREFGLLKALGASNSFVFKLVMGEAVLLGSAGAALGAGLALIGLFGVQAGLLFTEIPLVGLVDGAMARDMFAVMALIVAVAVLTALYPALAALRLEPYAAIRGGE
jgi:putative ABC transport system permease protein